MKFGSHLEEKFAQILNKAGIRWIGQYGLQRKRYDFFLPEYSLLVEIDGNYIHTNSKEGFHIDKKFKKKIFRNDALKNIMAKQAGFKLIRIWESELLNLNHTNIREHLLK